MITKQQMRSLRIRNASETVKTHTNRKTTTGIRVNTKNAVLLKFMAKVLPTFLFSLLRAIHIFQLVSIWLKSRMYIHIY